MFFRSIMADFLSLKNLKGKLAIITSWRCENALCLIYYFTIHTAFFFLSFGLMILSHLSFVRYPINLKAVSPQAYLYLKFVRI